jgi:hypothetical protein
MELVNLVCSSRVVDLVRDQDDRTPRAPEQIGHLLVTGRDPGLGVDDEEDEVGLLDRGSRLLRDLARDR